MQSFLDPNSRHPHPSTNTHGRDPYLLAGPAKFIEQRRNLPRSRATQRMSKSNGASIRIHLAMLVSLTALLLTEVWGYVPLPDQVLIP